MEEPLRMLLLPKADSPNGWTEPWPSWTSPIQDFIDGKEADDDDVEGAGWRILYMSPRAPSDTG